MKLTETPFRAHTSTALSYYCINYLIQIYSDRFQENHDGLHLVVSEPFKNYELFPNRHLIFCLNSSFEILFWIKLYCFPLLGACDRQSGGDMRRAIEP